MAALNIAVIGSGISGLSAAWLLSKQHKVTLFEQDPRLGGHTNTVTVETADGAIPVDTGFIVYNERNYPNLTALFTYLGVRTEPTQMTFAVSADKGAFEYAGSPTRLFGQISNLFRRRQWQLVFDLFRFFRTAKRKLTNYPADISLGAFLKAENYSDAYIEDHIIPMGAAVWCTSSNAMLDFPAATFIHFYDNHGMLQAVNQPGWRTVSGGSSKYVARMVADGKFGTVAGTPVCKVRRMPSCVSVEDADGVVRMFDQAIIATHADQALQMLAEPEADEQELLGAFSYDRNRTVLHRDKTFMPRRRRLWQSWNYLKRGEGFETKLCVTYWMNSLQSLPTETDLFVTLNPPWDIHPKAIDLEVDYDHPIFDAEAIDAQRRLWSLQGQGGIWFCGGYFGYGFHEDGLQSGLAVAEQLGRVRRPWEVEDESGRIHITHDAGEGADAPLAAAE
ncbi:MAG: FAD-dependent oxidoreductase [Pseudomonadota bacterium]